jgi:long-chain fatty acid transport protein
MRRSIRIALLGSIAGSALCIGLSAAQAGAFLLREQSTIGSGLSTAGAAADGAGLASEFWNPATITDYPGWQSSWSVTGIFPSANLTANPSSTLYGLGSQSGDIGRDALVPASYDSYQINDKLWLGLATYAPFGMVTKNPDMWAGSPFGLTSKVTSFDINPTVAYKITDTFSVAAGLQAMWFGARLTSAITPEPLTTATLKGISWGYGFTLGATWKPIDGTEVGVGYRSSVQENLNGSLTFGSSVGPFLGQYPAQVKLDLPDTLTIGLRQKITPDFTLLTGFEWDQWSLLGTVPVVYAGSGVVPQVIPFNYNDGWLASVGGEYKWNQNLTLRAGLAYEKSPIDDLNREVRLPDADRIWTSIGASYKVSDKISLDFAYSHLFPMNGTITSTLEPLEVSFSGTETSHIDIVSVGLEYRWDAPAASPAPVVARY